jgi:hypothetical protein
LVSYNLRFNAKPLHHRVRKNRRKPRRGGYILSIAHRLWHKNLTEIYGVEAARFGCWNRNTISGPAANTIAAVACFTSNQNHTFDLEWLWTNDKHTHTLVYERNLLRKKIREDERKIGILLKHLGLNSFTITHFIA